MSNSNGNIHATIYRLPDCPSGMKALKLLKEQQIPVSDHIRFTRGNRRVQSSIPSLHHTPDFPKRERIGGYESLRQHLQLSSVPEYSYIPVMAVFGTAGLMSLATASGFMGMMGFSLAMLAS